MQTSENKIPARIHAILAREADKAVVFRRGPSSKTAILEWDLNADKFKLGQWFYGSFYPYRCDISPDGRHLVYFAAKYGRGSSIDKYIAERAEAEEGPSSVYYYRKYKEIAADAKTGKEIERQVRAGEYYDCSWTAVSRVPYLKAFDLWFNGPYRGCPISRRLTFGSTAVDGTAADCSSTTSAWPSTICRTRRT